MQLVKHSTSIARATRPGVRAQPRHSMQVVCKATQKSSADVSRRALMMVLPLGLGSALAGSAQAKKVKAPPTPEEVVASVIAAREAGKDEEVLANMAKTVVWKTPKGYPNDPLGGEFKGRYGVVTYLTRWQAAVTGMKASNVKILKGDGPNSVIVQSKLSGVIKATGKKFSVAATEVYRVAADGSGIISIFTNYDASALAKAAGIKTEKA